MLKKIAVIISSILILTAATIGLITAVKAGRSAGEGAAYYMAEVTPEGMLEIRLFDENEKELTSGTLEMKLPAFEGLYTTDGVYYGVFSASDAEAGDVRFVIVKYDEKFEEAAVCEVSDSVTFDASSITGVSLEKVGDMLWLSAVSGVRAAGEVFAADVTYMITADTMTVADSMYHVYDAEMRDVLKARVYEDEGAVLAVFNDQEENVILYHMNPEDGRINVQTTESIFYNADQMAEILEKAENSKLVRITELSGSGVEEIDETEPEDEAGQPEVDADEAEETVDEAENAAGESEDADTEMVDELSADEAGNSVNDGVDASANDTVDASVNDAELSGDAAVGEADDTAADLDEEAESTNN